MKKKFRPKKKGIGKVRGVSEEIMLGGRNAVAAVLRSDNSRVKRLLLTSGAFTWLQENVREEDWIDVPYSLASREELDEALPGIVHQGCIGSVVPKAAADFATLCRRIQDTETAEFLLVLDGVTDPHNLGAVIRVAECFDATGVLLRRARSATLSATVAKTSVGASERVDIYEVANLDNALEKLKKLGFWIVAADCNSGSIALSRFEFPDRVALILGAEGTGIQQLLLERADFRVHIPMSGDVGSLNVSQAAAVFSWARTAARCSSSNSKP